MNELKTLFILEDQISCLERLISLLKNVFDSPELIIARNLEEASKLDTSSCNLALIDISLPDGKSFDFIIQHLRDFPNIPVVITTFYDDNETLYQAMSAGVSGYLLKADSDELLCHSLKSLLMGQLPVSPYITRRLMQDAALNGADKQPGSVVSQLNLSKRETEILQLISQGLLSKQVAHELGLSKHTIDSTIKRVYKKCGIRNRIEAHQFSVEHKLI